MTTAAEAWERIACPVCDGERFAPLFVKNGEPFVRCAGCGLVLINPRPRFEALRHTYDAAYSSHYIRKAEKKRRRARRTVARLRRRHRAATRWLDVGCSAGFVLEAARDAGFVTAGVELEPAACRFARERLGLDDIHCTTLEDAPLPAGAWDVITIHDVIEHVPDLATFLEATRRLLAPGGIVEIRTPDVGHWRVPRDLERWAEIKPSEHLYYFDRHTLTRLLARHGLQVRTRRFNPKPGLKVIATHATGAAAP